MKKKSLIGWIPLSKKTSFIHNKKYYFDFSEIWKYEEFAKFNSGLNKAKKVRITIEEIK